MPENNQVHLRGDVGEVPYFDLVPNSKSNGSGRIAFLRVMLWVRRDADQPAAADRVPADQVRVPAIDKNSLLSLGFTGVGRKLSL